VLPAAAAAVTPAPSCAVSHCRVLSMQPFLNATKLSLSLYCNATATPWCEPAAIGKRETGVRHASAVHAVVGA